MVLHWLLTALPRPVDDCQRHVVGIQKEVQYEKEMGGSIGGDRGVQTPPPPPLEKCSKQ